MMDSDFLREKKIIIFGCGQVAREFCRKYEKDLHIKQFWSNNRKEEVFISEEREYDVIRPKLTDDEESFIIICSTAQQEIAEQLMLYGYLPFQDYCGSDWAESVLKKKKKILFYGFCHLRAIKQCMEQSGMFGEQYDACYVPDYKSLDMFAQRELIEYAKSCDIFIYGAAVSAENKRKNRALQEILKRSCKQVCVPAIYFGGYFPQKQRWYNAMNPYAIKAEAYDYTPFSYGDSWFNECIDQGMDAEAIWERIQTGLIQNEGWICHLFEKEWKRCCIMEKESDFPVMDRLELIIRKKRLFRNETHMENDVIHLYVEQIKMMLGFKEKISQIKEPLLHCSQHVIYPEVAKALGLQWDVKNELLDLYTYDGWKKVTAKQYVEEYVLYSREIKKLKEKKLFP